MSHPFFAYISRLRYISRWGLMRNTVQENVQEHSHMVAVLAHALAVIDREIYGGQLDPGHVATVALYHDASEIFTGDLPTPVKYHNEEIQTAYRAIEASATQRLLCLLPAVLQETYAPLLAADTEESVHTLVKAADKLAAYIKCLEELKTGNLEFQSAAEQTRLSLTQMQLPALSYFMEQFLPAFSRNLDELQSQ